MSLFVAETIRAQLKQQLSAWKKQVGDDDEEYPDLMQVRNAYWD